MAVVAKPLVKAASPRRRWLGIAVVLTSGTISAIGVGATLGAAGQVARIPLTAAVPALGILTALYSLREVGVLNLPLPTSNWQVPGAWVRGGRYVSSARFGGILGLGFLTRAPYPSFFLLLGIEFVSGSWLVGALFGAMFGMARGESVILIGRSARWTNVQARHLHVINGIVLAFVGAFAIALSSMVGIAR